MRFLVVAALTACNPVTNYLDPDGPRFAGDHTTGAPQADGELLVITYNLEYGKQIDRAIEVLRTFSPIDVLVMQEMDSAGVDRIAAALAMRWVYYPGSRHDDADFGNAVLTRWPILADHKLLLPHHDPYRDRARIAVTADIDVAGTVVAVVSAHNTTAALGLGARLDQAETILKSLDGNTGPRIVAGDFNTADPDSLDQTVELFGAYGYAWSTAGVGDTLDTAVGDFAVDHVFAHGAGLIEAGVHQGDSGSDHEPVWTRLLWP